MSSEVAPVIAFLGAGNMASAMISGLIAEGFAPSRLHASDPSTEALSGLEALGLTHLGTSPEGLFERANLVVAAVKPQIIPSALTAVRDQLGPNTALLSIAAGIPISSLQTHAGEDVPIIRCMPNTPAMIGLGASALSPCSSARAAAPLHYRLRGALSLGIQLRVCRGHALLQLLELVRHLHGGRLEGLARGVHAEHRAIQRCRGQPWLQGAAKPFV